VLDLEVLQVDELGVVAAGEHLRALGLGECVVAVRDGDRDGGHSGWTLNNRLRQRAKSFTKDSGVRGLVPDPTPPQLSGFATFQNLKHFYLNTV